MASAARTDPRQEFLALLCADEDLLRAEFEAIVDANWDRPQPPRPTPPTPVGPPRRGPLTMPAMTGPGSASRERDAVWRRERSPPGEQ